MSRINVLSDALVNKIAAGEVVERPASVVKELVENAIDAGARQIRVAIEGGGLTSIVVQDDGIGMSREDAQLSLVRHATSKLRELDDLFEIQTMGFRGEAIPSIASVSRFTLLTSERGAPVGTQIELEGGANPSLTDAAPIGGTLIRVDELFFNTPARRKFLRREETEAKHAEEALIRIALANPEVGFSFDSGGKAIFSSKANAGDLRERIAAALGTEVHPHLLEVEEARLGLTVRGYVASPRFHLPNARGIYTFVNRRYIRDRGLNHSIQRAFGEFVPPGRQPVAVLFIDLDPRAVDVNVHPQKTEVRFADGRGIYDAVSVAVQRAVRAAMASESTLGGGASTLSTPEYALAVDRFLTRAQEAAWGAPLPIPIVADSAPGLGLGEGRPSFGTIAGAGINDGPPEGFFAALRLLGALGQRFWICEGRGAGLVVIDPHAARERLAMSRLLGQLSSNRGQGQRSLFSATVELASAEARHVSAQLHELEEVGVELEPFGGTHFALKSLPAALDGVEPQRLIPELAAVLTSGQPSPRARLLQVMACHAADVRAGLTEAEAREVLGALDEADFSASLRHPTVVVSEVPLLELERRARGGSGN